MKTLKDADLIRITLADFVLLSKKCPSVLFLPLFTLMEQIFTFVELEVVLIDDGMTESERKRAARNANISRRNSSSNAIQPAGSGSRGGSKGGSKGGSGSGSRRGSKDSSVKSLRDSGAKQISKKTKARQARDKLFMKVLREVA